MTASKAVAACSIAGFVFYIPASHVSRADALRRGLRRVAIHVAIRLPEIDGLQVRLGHGHIDGRAAAGEQCEDQEAVHQFCTSVIFHAC